MPKSREENKLVECPFNPAHILYSDKLQRHIMRCMVNYPNHYTCPFFAEHKFLNKNDYDLHILGCDRKRFIYTEAVTAPKRERPQIPQVDMPTTLDDEDW